MRTIYIANDGKRFDDEWDCKDYEKELFFKENESIIFGSDLFGNKIPFDENFYDKVYVIYLANQKAVEIFNEVVYNEGYLEPKIKEPGVYIWSDNSNEGSSLDEPRWIKITTLIKFHEEEIDHLMKLKNLLLKEVLETKSGE